MTRYLVDTSATIKYINRAFPNKALKFLDQQFSYNVTISFVTEIEMKAWNPPNPDEIEIYIEFIGRSYVIPITQGIIDESARIRKQHRLKLPDAIIAATAIWDGLTLITDNAKDFARIKELKQLYPTRI